MNINLELRGISHNESLSEETNAYSATLYLDGKKVARVSNHGQGGCDEQFWFDRDAEARVEAYFKAQPERASSYMIDGKPMMIQPDLEDWCGGVVTEWLIQRDYKRTLGRKVVMTDGKTDWSFKIKPADLGATVRFKGESMTNRAALLKAHPGNRIVNDFSAEELAAHIKASALQDA